MKVLGISTSTPFGSVGLVDSDRVVGEYSLNLPITHAERLMTSIDRLLTDAGVPLSEVEGLSVTLGPGSFTGLRIGISTAKGLAFAMGLPVAGVSTLEALALNVSNAAGEVCPILDARKKEVYAALFRVDFSHRVKRLTEDMAVSPRALVEKIHGPVTFLGEGLEVYGGFLKRELGQQASFAGPELGYVRGSVVARMGVSLLARGKTLDLATFVPRYVRRSEAEIRYEEGRGKQNR
ncbi:MAG: tRNA (adenosine(37)-N6)-threonylcarbamoyltransferase complex dimerization subunit type 1 TsaB [Deltaproteobacteria bacterium]|nr:tRNA (adenosine(37)-N6)-threonylcarbamoyltransferase complex dimerization subunit type 1 TsaB [Deltaproteobacteria bacterium]MBW2120309.1 tRNA (adenosine(37)-N6)-threonylcarbamoyltransferase complex dimerization subunit type 1 TsaB [Deltaproteobacteria bacterium]